MRHSLVIAALVILHCALTATGGSIPGHRSLGGSAAFGMDVYMAPVSVLSPWRVLDPLSINCRTVGKKPHVTIENPVTVTMNTWSGHETSPSPGFLCMGRKKVTKCTRGFGGHDYIEKSEYNFTPDLSRCADAKVKYSDHHIMEDEFPTPPCSWMSTQEVSVDAIHIESYTSEYDKVRGIFKDHYFASGHCAHSPCLIHTRDGYWFNTTNPETECKLGDMFDVQLPSNYKELPYSQVKMLSLMVHGTDLSGACSLKICNKTGYRLSTHEWVALSDGDSLKGVPPCSGDDVSIASLTEGSILQHMMSEVTYSADYKTCQKLKESLMAGAPVTRSDVSVLQPTTEGPNPVYMMNGKNLTVATAQYETLYHKTGGSDHQSAGLLGFKVVNNASVDWLFARSINSNMMDGPNGIFWYKGELINPRTWEGVVTGIMDEINAHYVIAEDTKVEEDSDKIDGIVDDSISVGTKILAQPSNWVWYLFVAVMILFVLYRVWSSRRNRRADGGNPTFKLRQDGRPLFFSSL